MRWLLLFVALSSTAAAADRLLKVRTRRTSDVKALLDKAGLTWPAGEAYLRVFKEERQVELWASAVGQPMRLVKTYDICAASGEAGPKRREGDLQVPEGLYEVSEYNPTSNYHLALKVSYPNRSDRVRSDRSHPGGLIYLHGNCASIGCIAIEDEPVEEVYLIAEAAKVKPLRIDLFPHRLTESWLREHADSPHAAFWQELAPAYAHFETTRRPAPFTVNSTTGAYIVR